MHNHPKTHSAQLIPIEEVARYPLPGMNVPGNINFSPDNRLITYLWSDEGSLTRQLYAFDLRTREQRLLVSPVDGGVTDENVSLEETLRRERQRQREFGVTSYAWAEKRNRLLIPLKGDLWVKDNPEAPLRCLRQGQDMPAIDAQISPDGEWVAYVQQNELAAIPFAGGASIQLTEGARETGKTHGLAEYIAQEEMGRSHGFWWSPDSQYIAFEEVDETHIPLYCIDHQGKSFTGESAQEKHHYPFAGGENARVRLGVISRSGGKPVWLDLSEDEDFYLARVNWLPDGSLAVQILNREQTRLDIYRYFPYTGEHTLLLREINPLWINLHNMFKPLTGKSKDTFSGFLWASERSGYRHLYLYNEQGELIRQLTQGDWMVDDIAGVDQVRQVVYFTATRESPLESHLYAVSFTGGEARRITQEPGIHNVALNSACSCFVDTHHSLDNAPTVRLRSLEDGSLLTTIFDRPDPRVEKLGIYPPELAPIENRNNDRLYGAIYRPAEQFGCGPFPTIVFVYGGPHVQMVANSWLMTANMRAQYLRSLGFLVFVLDNRGSARRGLVFEAPIKYRLGQVEVEDQVDGVRWLIEKGLADPERVGIIGWSYGGYLAALSLARAPETFRAAIAGAPVTAWDGYDTCYTERYMGTPQFNPKGYEESNVMHYVGNLRGKLLLIHGLLDENVHFRHTARLINALIAARKPYDLLLFPDERHMPRKPGDRIYMEELIRDYLLDNLAS